MRTPAGGDIGRSADRRVIQEKPAPAAPHSDMFSASKATAGDVNEREKDPVNAALMLFHVFANVHIVKRTRVCVC